MSTAIFACFIVSDFSFPRFMQPQGHVQVLFNTLRGFTPQASLDAPRFCISSGLPDAGTKGAADAGNVNSEIWFEEGIAPEVIDELKRKFSFG